MMDEATFITVQQLVAEVIAWDWPFARAEATRIEAHWQALLAHKPRLFNGRVLLMRDFEIRQTERGQVFHSRWFETEFKAFLAWRDFGFPTLPAPHNLVRNGFAMAALRSADGAFLLGEMGAHTANAGKIYFAAGTPDPDDVRGSKLDLEGSALRELTEETGIAPGELTQSQDWTLVFQGARVACMRDVCLPLTAAEIVSRVGAYLACDPDPELARLVPVHGMDEIDSDHMPAFVVSYLRHVLRR